MPCFSFNPRVLGPSNLISGRSPLRGGAFCALLFFAALIGVLGVPERAMAQALDGHRVDAQQPGGINLGRLVRYLEDSTDRLTVDQVMAQPPQRWRTFQHDVPNLGYNHSAIWFNVSIDGLNDGQDRLLEVGYALLDHVDIWFVSEGQLLQHVRTGDHEPFSSREVAHRHFLFPVPHSESRSVDVWMRVRTEGTVEVPFTLWRTTDFMQNEQHVLVLKGLYYGVIAVMIFYNCFIYLSVREVAYLYYVLYATSLLLFQVSLDGFAFQWFWPEQIAFNEASFNLLIIFVLIFICLFSNSFLQLKDNFPKLSQLMIGTSVGGIILAASSPLIAYADAIRMTMVFSISVLTFCLGAGVHLLFYKVSMARYYVAGWCFFLAGTVVVALSKFGVVPTTFFSNNAIQLGSSLEAVIFSLALADRINIDRHEKLLAKQEAIQNLEMFKSLYENAIEGIFQCTVEGRFVSANPSMAQLLGYLTEEELVRNLPSVEEQTVLDRDHYREFIEQVLKRGQVLNYEAKGRRRDGTPFWASLSAKLMRSAGEPLIEGFTVDISSRKKSEEQLQYLAHHDPLTGLVNRREFEVRLQRMLFTAHREKVEHALLYMDLDQFKLVNDSCGHVAGDELLRQITWQLQQQMRSGDTLARLGGDEFGVLLERCDRQNAFKVASKLKSVVQDFRFVWDDKFFVLGVSIGLVSINSGSRSVADLLSLADSACYAAKDGGRNRIHEYQPGDKNLLLAQSEMQWVGRINEALDQNLFVLYQQAIVPVVGDPMTGEEIWGHCEVLIRMRDAGGGILPPGAFLPAAERYNLMPAIDRWVIKTLFSFLASHPELTTPNHLYAVNLSGASLGGEEFENYVLEQFSLWNIPPQLICFEITETMAVTNLAVTSQFMTKLKAIGCSFSLDDFGSGFSSYGYLKSLPVDYLKIDGLFVVDIVDDKIDFAMVESINRIAQVMGKKTIAEFVENNEIRKRLKRLGVDYAQGYGIAKPQPLV
ncbi:PAS sensor protein [gamma proteobacterium HdN1]|nr:PAS sensor protein [gamma proteobacterium HdN1]